MCIPPFLFLYKGEEEKMLQAYSRNLTFTDQAAIPLNSAIIQKGCTAVLAAPATIELNKAGVYMVSCDVVATAGSGTVQMYKNGVAQPFAKAIIDADSGSFTSLVQVPQNNSKCCCISSPTTLQFIYDETAATTGDINVVITKIC